MRQRRDSRRSISSACLRVRPSIVGCALADPDAGMLHIPGGVCSGSIGDSFRRCDLAPRKQRLFDRVNTASDYRQDRATHVGNLVFLEVPVK